MPARNSNPPKYRCYRPKNLGVVRINGHDHYLGRYNSKESWEKYGRLIGEWKAGGSVAPAPASAPTPPVPTAGPEPLVELPPASEVTITILVNEFRKWAKKRYVKRDGTPTREFDNFWPVLAELRQKYGELRVNEFGSAKLLELRGSWVRGELSEFDRKGRKLGKRVLARHTINTMVRRVRQIFRWGVSRELVDERVVDRLASVHALVENEGGHETTGAREPVDWALVESTLPFLPPLLQAFVVVGYHSGARRSELARLTTGMIDRSGDVWVADLAEHKTAHKGKRRRLFFGPKAQAALTPWLLPNAPGDPIFSPLRVDDRQAKRTGKRLPGRFYNRSSLDQALRRAIARAKVESWTLGQLRHSASVAITDAISEEACRQSLGHSNVAMTRHYNSKASAAAINAARLLG